MNKSMLQVVILTFATIIIWIGYSIYSIQTTRQSVNVDPQYLTSVDPTLNKSAIDTIVKNQQYILVDNKTLGLKSSQ